MNKDIQFYIDELRGNECQCGRPKWSKRSFCYRCYKELPYDMRRALWSRIGCGYDEAYDNAVHYLNT